MITEMELKAADREIVERPQKPNEPDQWYLEAARKYAAYMYRKLRSGEHPTWGEEFCRCHYSHAVAEALRLTEKRFVDLGTSGVEGDCALNGEGHPDIEFLNAGDIYDATIVHYGEKFRVCSLADVADKVMEV